MRWEILRDASIAAALTAGVLHLIARPGLGTLASAGALVAFFSVARDLRELRQARKPPRERIGRTSRALLGVSREQGEVVVEEARTDLLGHSEAGLALPMRVPRRAAWVMGVFAIAAFAWCAGALATGDPAQIAIAGTLSLMMAWVLSIAIRGVRGRPRVLLTATGLAVDHPAARVAVRWEDIESVAMFARGNVPMIGVEAPSGATIRTSGSRVMSRLSRLLSGHALEVPPLSTGADPEAMLGALAAYMDDPSPLRDPARERAGLAARLAPGS